MALDLIDDSPSGDKWLEAIAKINDTITTLNLLDLGVEGQVFKKTGGGFLEGDWQDVLPAGGDTRAALLKNSATDFDVDFYPIHEVPSGGDTDYVLTKNSATDFDASFIEVAPSNSVALSADALTYLTAGVMYYAKIGKIVTVTLNFSLIDVGFPFLVNATAFPPPITPFTFLLLDDITSGRNDYKMDASGFISKLFLGSGTVNGSCTFSYICA
jgi:hypothetical protein